MCSDKVCGWNSCARPRTRSSNSARFDSPSSVTLKAARARIPWRIALRLERALPSGLRGPVERRALARLAATLRSLVGRLGDGLAFDASFFIASFLRAHWYIGAARVGGKG